MYPAGQKYQQHCATILKVQIHRDVYYPCGEMANTQFSHFKEGGRSRKGFFCKCCGQMHLCSKKMDLRNLYLPLKKIGEQQEKKAIRRRAAWPASSASSRTSSFLHRKCTDCGLHQFHTLSNSHQISGRLELTQARLVTLSSRKFQADQSSA